MNEDLRSLSCCIEIGLMQRGRQELNLGEFAQSKWYICFLSALSGGAWLALDALQSLGVRLVHLCSRISGHPLSHDLSLCSQADIPRMTIV